MAEEEEENVLKVKLLLTGDGVDDENVDDGEDIDDDDVRDYDEDNDDDDPLIHAIFTYLSISLSTYLSI